MFREDTDFIYYHLSVGYPMSTRHKPIKVSPDEWDFAVQGAFVPSLNTDIFYVGRTIWGEVGLFIIKDNSYYLLEVDKGEEDV